MKYECVQKGELFYVKELPEMENPDDKGYQYWNQYDPEDENDTLEYYRKQYNAALSACKEYPCVGEGWEKRQYSGEEVRIEPEAVKQAPMHPLNRLRYVAVLVKQETQEDWQDLVYQQLPVTMQDSAVRAFLIWLEHNNFTITRKQ